jgi:hypothetical protein
MTTHNTNIGEAVHGPYRFKPKGTVYSFEEGAMPNPSKRIGGGSLSARFFVGLNVGRKKAHSVDDIIAIVRKVRKKQKHEADASILAQKGIYEDRSGRLIVEPSVQVILIDFAGTPKATFTREMRALGQTLCDDLRQEKVILEIQKSGVVVDVYAITP